MTRIRTSFSAFWSTIKITHAYARTHTNARMHILHEFLFLYWGKKIVPQASYVVFIFYLLFAPAIMKMVNPMSVNLHIYMYDIYACICLTSIFVSDTNPSHVCFPSFFLTNISISKVRIGLTETLGRICATKKSCVQSV